MTDFRISALGEAHKAWGIARYLSYAERIQLAKDLHTYGLFSLNQLGKIVGLTAGGVARHCVKTDNKGGRFQPEALEVLIHIRRVYLEQERVNANLVQAAIDAGCSASCIAALTGTPYSTVYHANQRRNT